MTQWAKPPECREQQVLFPLKLDDAVPTEHLVRLFDEILGRLDWSSWEACYHPYLGQPAIHPRVLASILLYGLLHRIRSSRLLERATQMQLDFRWLAHGHAPDHTTLSEFRRNFQNRTPGQHSPLAVGNARLHPVRLPVSIAHRSRRGMIERRAKQPAISRLDVNGRRR
jgi:transposase